MQFSKKIIRKIQQGSLRDVIQELLWIYQYGLKYKGSIFFYILLGCLGIVTGLTGSVISKHIIDAVTGYDSEVLLSAALAYVILQLFTIGFRAWSSILSEKIALKVDQEIRADVYDKIMDADWEALMDFHSGDLLNRVDNDVSSVSGSVLGWIPNFVTRTLQFAGTLGVILYYDATLAILALLSAPVTLLISRSVSKRIRTYSKKIKAISSDVMVFNEESFQNVQVIKSFGLTEAYKKKLRGVQENYWAVRTEYNRFQVLSGSGMSLIGSCVAIVCFGWGVYRLWTGHITYGTMTLFLQLSTSLANSFSVLVHMIPSAIAAATAAGRLMNVTSLPKEVRCFEEEAEELIRSRKGIEVRADNISFRYRSGKTVLENASFVAKPGEIVAVVGASGEGKTTMLRILLGLVSVNEGYVTVNAPGEEAIPVSASTRALFSYVPQENVMFSGTVEENLRVTDEKASQERIKEVLEKACAYDFVQKRSLGLSTQIKENGGGFSEGQIQRLAIARALLSDAPILLFDEATSALDVATERKILKNILEKSNHKTCIVTTHRPSVLSICDRIYRITDGQMEVMTKDAVETMIADF